ncbi:CHAT domain-containing protein [Catalinimonas alkaloidigena]|uniref:CHAT domain-containing protein n=1 Tax=Catalinimonas alkaloidigena TaxID=1075417 RepID=UPI002406FF88|nr:CHAT domain-containing tetratricopeptide repeat protein [Catalinimonas alkaloidigena]MDF9795469.1 CHAT domain-containing protein [Catalinimonas alkaloidigena]
MKQCHQNHSRLFWVLTFLFLLANSHCFAQNVSREYADNLYQQGSYAEAAEAYHQLATYQQSEEQNDSLVFYQYWEAKCYIQQYAYDEGRSILEGILSASALTLNPSLLSKVYHEIGYTYMGEGDLEQAMEYSRKSIDTELGRAATDSFQLAKYYELKGFMSMQAGAYGEAEKWVKHAHQLRKNVLDPVDKELGYSANTLYIILSALGKLEEAEAAIAEAWTILQHHLPEEHPHIAVLANNYSTHLLDMGDPQQAKTFLLKAIVSNRKGERYLPLAQNYVNLGLLYLNLNESKTAESYYLQAWEIADTLISYPDYQRANIRDALGAAYYQQEQYVKADSMFSAALAEKRDLYKTETAEIAQSFFNLGLIAEERKDWQQAKSYFAQSEQIRAETVGADHPKRADALYELGSIAWELDQQAQAISYWKKAFNIYHQKFGLTHHHAQENLLQLAIAYEQLQMQDSLRNYLHMAWGGASGMNAPITDFKQLDTLQIRVYSPKVLDLVNFHLGLFLAQGHNIKKEDLHIASNIFTAVQHWLPTFQSLYNDASLYESVSDQLQTLYRQSAVLAHRALAYEQGDQEVWENLLLNCIQASRGATIQLAFKDRQAISFAGVPDSLVARSQVLKEQLRFSLLRQQDSENNEEAAEIAIQQQSILQSWQELQQQLKQDYPQYYEARYAIQPPTKKEIQARLAEQKYTALAYFDLDSALLTVQIEPRQLKTSWLNMPAGWQDSLQQYQQLYRQEGKAKQKAALGYFLYQQLWQPLDIPADAPVKILADGPLHYLNFETLLTHQTAEESPMAAWPWLLRDYCVYYGHSLAGSNTVRGSAGKGVLGIAPGFSQDLKNNYLDQLPQHQQADSTFLSWLRTPWSLAFARQLQEEGWGTSLTEQSATETLLLTQANEASVLHFGTHARLQNESPLYSFLALTPQPQQEQDGYLYAYELYSKPLNVQLAVLTACETGLGKYRRGEGVLSLAHAFRYAGCPTVIYSLWSIDDQQSNQIAEGFYRHLHDNMTAAEALRAAKLSFLEKAEGSLQSPYYWGGLVLTGDNTEIHLNSTQYAGWSIGLGLGIFIIIALFFIRHLQKRKASLKR